MLNQQYTAVLTLAILVTLGIIPKSVAFFDKVKPYSFLEDQSTVLKENSSIRESNLTINFAHIDSTDDSKGTILAQNVAPDTSGKETFPDENKSINLWWLAPLIILVPFLGFLLFKPGSKPEQVDEEQTTSTNLTDTVEESPPTPQNVTSEFAVDYPITDKTTQEDKNIEEIDNISLETSPESKLLDDIQEQFEDDEPQSEQYVQESNLEINQSRENASFAESSLEAEEIISEPLVTPSSELELIENENLESISAEEFTVSEEIVSSQPDLLATIDEISTEIEPAQTEKITDQELANISEWLNEKIDSDNKDISVMDDFWDNLSSITEEISTEIEPAQTEKITDQELANISEWLNENVEPTSNFGDLAQKSLDNLPDLDEGIEQVSNQELLDSSLNLEEEQNHHTKTKEGISDLTSNILEELLNEDSSQENKY